MQYIFQLMIKLQIEILIILVSIQAFVFPAQYKKTISVYNSVKKCFNHAGTQLYEECYLNEFLFIFYFSIEKIQLQWLIIYQILDTIIFNYSLSKFLGKKISVIDPKQLLCFVL